MPFKSDAQRRLMYARHPQIARRWQAETPKGDLPEHVGDKPMNRIFKEVLKGKKDKPKGDGKKLTGTKKAGLAPAKKGY